MFNGILKIQDVHRESPTWNVDYGAAPEKTRYLVWIHRRRHEDYPVEALSDERYSKRNTNTLDLDVAVIKT